MKKMNGMRCAVMAMMVIGTLCACTDNAPKNEPVAMAGTPTVEAPVAESPTDNISEGASPEAEIPVVAPIDDVPEGASPEVELPPEYDAYSKELLMNTLSCEEKDAERILREIGYVNSIGNGNIKLSLTSVEKVEEGSEYWQSYSEINDIVIEDADSVKYYLMLLSSYELYMAKNLDADEIVYAIVE